MVDSTYHLIAVDIVLSRLGTNQSGAGSDQDIRHDAAAPVGHVAVNHVFWRHVPGSVPTA